jgi:hypothetical protein
MARISPGTGIADARNAQGTIVFSRNRGGLYTRARIKPINPKTTTQVYARANFTTVSKAWYTQLTDTQRLAWITFADATTDRSGLTGPKHLSGFQWFTKVNIAHYYLEGTYITTPPATKFVAQPLYIPTADLNLTTSTFLITIPTTPPANHLANIFSAKWQNPGTTKPRHGIHTEMNTIYPPATSVNVYGNYTPNFTVPPAGVRIFFRLALFNLQNGLYSNDVWVSALTHT